MIIEKRRETTIAKKRLGLFPVGPNADAGRRK